MDNQMNGLKDIYECIFRATYDMKIGDRSIKTGEPIVMFDSLQLVDFQEIKKRIDAKGGYNNQTWVSWESTQEEQIAFSQGTLSKTHLAILGNAVMMNEEVVEVPKRETGEILEDLRFHLRYEPILNSVFVYDANTGAAINFSLEGQDVVCEADPYTEIEVYYNFNYKNANIISIGRQLIKGYISMTAKTRLKDDVTGKIVTGIISIPKMKLMSDFSVRLGNDAPPATGYFKVSAFPTGSKGSEKVMDIILLNDDIDSDE